MQFKILLFRLLGKQVYLRLISRLFLRLYRYNMLKNFFPQHYYIKKLIQEGDTVLDLGANLGYYTIPMALACGPRGRCIAVEPIPEFRKVLEDNIRDHGLKNVEIIPHALGTKDHEPLLLGIPREKGYRHGLTRVIPGGKEEYYLEVHPVESRTPEKLFTHLRKVNFIKCDIEGYEKHILPGFKPLLEKWTPKVQIEIGNRESAGVVFEIFREQGYRCYQLVSGELAEVPDETEEWKGDLYFMKF